MKPHLLKITLLTILFIGLVAITGFSLLNANKFENISTAEAIGDLSVDWGVPSSGPIFTISNMAPGQSVSHTVIVSNGATTIRPIGVRGLETSDTGSLSDVLIITITENSVIKYGPASLTQFFTTSAGPDGVQLSTLNPGQQTQYIFSVQFNPLAQNQYQNKSMTFDLFMGISVTLPQACLGTSFTGIPIFGTEKKDNLNGTQGNDIIISLEGDDHINGLSGQDCIIGGPGNDNLNGNNGNDYLDGGPGKDQINGNGGTDTCSTETKSSPNCEIYF